VPPATLLARRVRWVLPLPIEGPRLLAEADSDSPSRVPATLPAKPASTTRAQTPLPAPEPSQNLAGGLSIARQLGLGVSRIVIDPGHGGHDPGAKGAGTTEAEIVLDVALRLEKLLSKVEGVEVVLTRRDDQFVPLQERTAIANREGADLFLSIHANASNVQSARGIETYFLNFASNGNAAAVAARENATSQQTMGALQDVVKAIALNSKVNESRDFATYVQREMLDRVRPANKTVKDLGVKQAPFVVLIGASMPSVLAEISFITNPQEAKLLKSSSFRQRVAQALFEGIREYQGSLKRVPEITQQQN
jgi:N-acetylmuramoyl-L-alanine amidase